MTTLHNIVLDGKHGKPIGLDLFYEPTGKPKPIVIFAHGFKGFKDWGHFDLVGQQIAAAGMVFIKFNFSHNGTTIDNPTAFGDLEAFGHNNYCIELDDLGVVIDWILNQPEEIPAAELDATKVSLIGHSRGGGIVLLKTAEEERIDKVVCWASVSELGRYWSNPLLVEEWKEKGVFYIMNGRTKQNMPLYYQFCEVGQQNQERLDVEKVVKAMKNPLLIVHGTTDPAVKYKAALELKAWKPDATLLTIENGNHVFGAKHPWEEPTLPAHAQEVVQATIEFIRN